MFCVRRLAVVTMVLAGSLIAAAPTHAQSDPDQARFRIGSLSISPAIRLGNVGWDSNVYNRDDAQDPQGDVTAAASPIVELWVRSPRVQMNGRSEVDYYYFRELTDLRAVDVDQSGRVDVTLNRLQPFVGGSYATTRHRQNFEIDAIVERHTDAVEGGTAIRLTSKTFLQLSARRSRVEYELGATFNGTDLARSLNHTATQQGLAVQYRLTPLTSISLDVQRGQTDFDLSPERNSDSFRIGPSVEFKPLALIRGRASLSWRSVTFEGNDQPDFRSSVAFVDLGYTFRGRTQVAVTALRDLEYSYRETSVDYVLAGVNTTVTQRLGQRWDAVGSIGRYGLKYRGRSGSPEQLVPPAEAVVNSGIGLGYYLGRHRLALDLQRNSRTSDLGGRAYRRFRVATSLTYIF